MPRLRPLLLVLAAVLCFACAREQALARPDDGTPAVAVDPAPAAATEGLEVRYLGNEGFLVSAGETRVLIDALFGEGIPGYDVVPSDLREAVEQGRGDWAGVTVAIASHFHPDHFDPRAVARFLEANPRAVFVSTPQAAERFARSTGEPSDLLGRFRAVLPAPGAVETLELPGVAITVLNLHHGPGNPPTENLGVVVSLGGRRFLHFGDTEAKWEDFEPYLEEIEGADVALLPFWFLSSDWRAGLVEEHLRPARVVVAHMPMPDAPAGYFARWNSYDELRSVIETRFPEAWIPAVHGQPMPGPVNRPPEPRNPEP